jgi:signal peptidase II
LKAFLAYAAAALLAALLDQGVKQWAEAVLPFHELVPVLPFLGLYRTYNTGVAFSMFSGSGAWGLLVMTALVIGFVLFLALRTEGHQRVARLGFALVVGGALGNLADRSLHGHVIDYVLFHTPVWSFAIFNLADAFITVGAGLVLLDELLLARRRTPAPDAGGSS